MKNMITGLLMATSLTFTAVACGGGGADKLAALSKEACECKDIKCFEGVDKKMNAAMDELAKKYPKKEDAPKEMVAELMKSMEKAGKCRAELAKAEKK